MYWVFTGIKLSIGYMPVENINARRDMVAIQTIKHSEEKCVRKKDNLFLWMTDFSGGHVTPEKFSCWPAGVGQSFDIKAGGIFCPVCSYRHIEFIQRLLTLPTFHIIFKTYLISSFKSN